MNFVQHGLTVIRFGIAVTHDQMSFEQIGKL